MKTTCWFGLVLAAALPLVSSYGQAPAVTLSPGVADVVKLVGAGTSEDVVVTYIINAQTPFNLSADQILYLKDVGISSVVITAMLNRDAALATHAPPPAVAAPTPTAPPAPAVTAPAPAYVGNPPADVAYFYSDLAPYGTWVDLPGYGWCWRPTVVVGTPGWQPYCTGGHWLYTEAGWYWASDYSWGWAPFHYGRWYLDARCGWVWLPGRVWAPAWVVWRSGGDYCGWAPLPPRADFVAGVGWRFNGVSVSVNFDFGLNVGCFTFIATRDFCRHDLGHYRLPPAQITPVYNRTTIINNYTVVNNTVVNHGLPVTRIESATGTRLPPARFKEPPAGLKPGQSTVSGQFVYAPKPLAVPPKPAGPMMAVKYDPKRPLPVNSLASSSAYAPGTTPQGFKPGASGTAATTGTVKPATGANPALRNNQGTTSSTRGAAPTHYFEQSSSTKAPVSTGGALKPGTSTVNPNAPLAGPTANTAKNPTYTGAKPASGAQTGSSGTASQSPTTWPAAGTSKPATGTAGKPGVTQAWGENGLPSGSSQMGPASSGRPFYRPNPTDMRGATALNPKRYPTDARKSTPYTGSQEKGAKPQTGSRPYLERGATPSATPPGTPKF